jgi:hypothetical protein
LLLGSGAFPALALQPAKTAVSGTWVLQQAGSIQELEQLRPALDAALSTPHLRGLSLRTSWKALDSDFALLDAGRALARRHSLSFAVRFMAGRHTPAHVFEAGSPFYLRNGEKVPVPFLPDGAPNTFFEADYKQLVVRLASWCRSNSAPLLHLAWYGQDWAELNHGIDVRAAKGYSYENWLTAHLRLIDIAIATADRKLSTELPFSGHGPLTDVAMRFADYVVGEIGGWNPLFFCQANGWGPRGEWGAPNQDTEDAFDRVWKKPVCRGLQMIQPQDYDWTAVFARLYQTLATYCEVYAPSFALAHAGQLADEIRKFMTYCQKQESGS